MLELFRSGAQELIRRVENLVGLRVTEVNITVNDVLFPGSQEQQG